MTTTRVCQRRLSANGKDDNEAIPEVVHRCPGIYLMAEEKTRKPRLGDQQMKTMRPVIASN
jgi:hypothetical protein